MSRWVGQSSHHSSRVALWHLQRAKSQAEHSHKSEAVKEHGNVPESSAEQRSWKMAICREQNMTCLCNRPAGKLVSRSGSWISFDLQNAVGMCLCVDGRDGLIVCSCIRLTAILPSSCCCCPLHHTFCCNVSHTEALASVGMSRWT